MGAVINVMLDFHAPAQPYGPDHPYASRGTAAGSALQATNLRLVFVVRGTESYGTGTKIIGLLESLAARGATIHMYVLGNGHLMDRVRLQPSATVVTDPAVPPRFQADRSRRSMAFARTMLASLPFVRRLTAYLRHTPCDGIVFCEHGLVLQLGLVARMAGTRAFWVMANGIGTGYPFDLNRHVYDFAFRHLAIVPVANSEHTRQSLGRSAHWATKIDLGINPDRVAVFGAAALQVPALQGPALQVPALQVQAATVSEAGLGRIRLLIMSRLVQTKGHLLLLQAILANPAFHEIDLAICGGPLGTPYTDTLMREAAAHGASLRLHLLGPTSDVARQYAMADIIVNARLDPEPFGLSIVEAMLAGKPVLVHASGGPADIVLDGVTGWHMAAPTQAAFAAGLARMLADRPRWPDMGQAAMARARQHYTHHTMTDQLLAIITQRLRHS